MVLNASATAAMAKLSKTSSSFGVRVYMISVKGSLCQFVPTGVWAVQLQKVIQGLSRGNSGRYSPWLLCSPRVLQGACL